MGRDSNSRTQESRILWLLQAAWPNWTPAPELAKISLQYGRAINTIRRKWRIEIANRVRAVNGAKHGEFRLGSVPVPSGKELRLAKSEGGGSSLFDMEGGHRDG
jgi:hypothetical protein